MHHPTDMITHTTAFVTPVVEHWLEREIAQWVYHEGSIRRSIAKWANALTTELIRWETENKQATVLKYINTFLLKYLAEPRSIGHMHLTHSYILKKDPPPLCEHCQCILTVRHILVECNHFAQERKDIFGRRDVMESFRFHPTLILIF